MTIRNFNSSVLSPRPKSKTQRRGLAVLHNAHIQRQGAAADRFRGVLEVLLLGRCLRYISRFGRHDHVSCLLLKLRIVIFAIVSVTPVPSSRTRTVFPYRLDLPITPCPHLPTHLHERSRRQPICLRSSLSPSQALTRKSIAQYPQNQDFQHSAARPFAPLFRPQGRYLPGQIVHVGFANFYTPFSCFSYDAIELQLLGNDFIFM